MLKLSSAEYDLCGINYCTKLDGLTVIYNPIPTPFNLLMHQGNKLPEQKRQALKYRKIIYLYTIEEVSKTEFQTNLSLNAIC